MLLISTEGCVIFNVLTNVLFVAGTFCWSGRSGIEEETGEYSFIHPGHRRRLKGILLKVLADIKPKKDMVAASRMLVPETLKC